MGCGNKGGVPLLFESFIPQLCDHHLWRPWAALAVPSVFGVDSSLGRQRTASGFCLIRVNGTCLVRVNVVLLHPAGSLVG